MPQTCTKALLDLFDAIEVGSMNAVEARKRAYECAERIPCSDVHMVYRELVRRVDNGGDQLNRVLLQCGTFAECLDDALTLSPCTRKAKWDEETYALQSEAQRRSTAAQDLLECARRRTFTSQVNARALASWNQASTVEGMPDWIYLNDDELLRKPPCFWWSLPLQSLPNDAQKICMGRLSALAEAYGRGRFPKCVWLTYDELFTAHTTQLRVEASPDAKRPQKSTRVMRAFRSLARAFRRVVCVRKKMTVVEAIHTDGQRMCNLPRKHHRAYVCDCVRARVSQCLHLYGADER